MGEMRGEVNAPARIDPEDPRTCAELFSRGGETPYPGGPG